MHDAFVTEKIHTRLCTDSGKDGELYDEASFEKKKMIVNCLIKRVEVFRGYKLKVEFNIDFEQFMVGIDRVA